MVVKKSVQKHRAVAAQQMMKVVLMFPLASTIYERQNQQLIGSKLMLVSFLYFSNCMYNNVMYRNPRIEMSNHSSRRLEIDRHTNTQTHVNLWWIHSEQCLATPYFIKHTTWWYGLFPSDSVSFQHHPSLPLQDRCSTQLQLSSILFILKMLKHWNNLGIRYSRI